MTVYYVWSGATGTGTGATWANAFTTLTLAFATEAAGDTLYVAHDHAESSGASLTLTSSGTVGNPTKVICVNRAGSVPPVAADRRTTATVSNTVGSVAISMNGFTHYDGIIFNSGNNGASGAFNIPGTNQHSLRFDNCSLRFAATSGTASLQIGGNAGAAIATYVELNNTTMSFGAVGQNVTLNGIFKWRNTASALIGSAVPTILLAGFSGRGALVEIAGVDLSAAGSGKTLISGVGTVTDVVRFIDCKLNASVTKASSAFGGPGAVDVDFIRSSASGNYAVSRIRYTGTLDQETTIVRTGGATDGTTPLSWKVATSANCNYSLPFECPPIAIWNDTTGSAKTATIECVWGGGAVPLDSEIWVDVEYLGDASSPQGSFVNDGTPDLITTPANQTSSSATWGGSTTKFKLNVTLTAQQKGWLYARVKCAKASSTFYIDPLITLT